MGTQPSALKPMPQSEPLVHRVDGRYPQIHYFDNTLDTVLDEVEQTFDVSENIYLIVADISWIAGIGVGGSRAGGVGAGWRNGGFTLIPSETILVPSERGWIVAAHELGHAFGLKHDFRDDAYIMSYGRQPNALSICNAEFLAVHPYFNPNVNTSRRRQPTVERISPHTYPTDAKSVQVQFKIRDSEGLHQTILFAQTIPPHFAAGHSEVKAWHRLAGEKEAVVTFDYDGVIPSAISTSLSKPIVHPISVYVVDTNGNRTWRSFTLWDVATVSSGITTLVDDALADFSLFADAFGSSDPHFDFNANGTVDFADFFLFAEAADESERDQLFALAKELIGLPESAQLYQNAPNPFNSQTVLSYFLPTPGSMRLEVFTLSGQRVAVLNTGPQQAGRHRLAWDGRDSEGRPLASGVYLYRLVSAGGVLTRKLILLR